MSIDIVHDFVSGVDKIDVSGIDANLNVEGDQSFVFKGTSANKNAGDLTYKVYGNINAAEKALGIDIDGVDGPGAPGQVTVVFGNVDGGTPDFAIVLLNTRGIVANDFIDDVVPDLAATYGDAQALLYQSYFHVPQAPDFIV